MSSDSAVVGATASAVPDADIVFEPVRDRYGLRLPLVFGNHAPGGLCPYYVGDRCHHCDIGAGEGAAFDRETNRARLGWFARHYADQLGEVAHLVLYNSGSMFARREMPADMLHEILDWARTLPALRVVSIDSREAFITEASVAAAAEHLDGAHAVRPILGLETANHRLRNLYLRKKMPWRSVERAFAELARLGRAIGRGRVGMDVNVLVAGPGTDASTAAKDAERTARFTFELANRKGVSVDLNLHPYYPSRRGVERFPHVGRCSPATLMAAIAAVCSARDEMAPAAGVFVGVDDEGHDEAAAWGSARYAETRAALERFNVDQDVVALSASVA